jgi:hypothetical protein
MENQPAPTVDYNSLTKRGLQLSENDFNLIRDSLGTGAEEAKKYLNVATDVWPKFIFESGVQVLGYSSQHDAISLSLNLLNQAAARTTNIEYKDQLLCFMPDVFYIIVKYTYWLKLLGREATVHRYQKIGNPLLKKKFPEVIPASLSSRALLLSDVEVEARTITDAITIQLGEIPIWKNFDAYFSKNHAEYYNKPIDELEKLPKLTLPISFEMEYYTV